MDLKAKARKVVLSKIQMQKSMVSDGFQNFFLKKCYYQEKKLLQKKNTLK